MPQGARSIDPIGTPAIDRYELGGLAPQPNVDGRNQSGHDVEMEVRQFERNALKRALTLLRVVTARYPIVEHDLFRKPVSTFRDHAQVLS